MHDPVIAPVWDFYAIHCAHQGVKHHGGLFSREQPVWPGNPPNRV